MDTADLAPLTSASSWNATLAALADPSLDPLFWRAERLGVPSAWWQHVPFAHWIVCATAPRLLVELGTHAGVSYAAFCQAAARENLPIRCHAVDTWRGDHQAGQYGEEVFQELSRFHDERFGAFSTLLRCTFDEALDQIEDGAVDLLHIDGLHTYEAVRHDFEAWLPKLSDRAVVLFHDTNVRRDDFGVHRLWGELAQRHPSFQFLHGHGLGVLAVGENPPPAVADLCRLTEPNAIAAIRTRFAWLGERWLNETQARLTRQDLASVAAQAQHLRVEAARLAAEAEAARGHASQVDQALQEAVARTLAAEAARAEAEAARAKAEVALVKAEAERARLEAAARASVAAAEKAEAERAQLEVAANAALAEGERAAQVERARLEAAANAAVAEALRDRDSILYSTTWRATQPIRRLGRRFPRPVRHTLRRTLRTMYRMSTLRFSQRTEERQDAQIADAPAAEPEPALLADASAPAPALLPAPSQAAESEKTIPSVPELLAERFPALQPYPCFPVAGVRPRLSLVTDGVGPLSLFGGVGTSIILGTLLANRLNADLRIVTRLEPPDTAPVREVLLCNDIALDGALEVAMAPLDGSVDLPLADGEIFLTTSWWTTRASFGVVPPSRIVALVQEDERMFYPQGDERLRCTETLSHPCLTTVVNTEMLFRHLVSGREPLANLAQDGMWFEPAFPQRARPRAREGKRRFFFYARPHNHRNLFWRGIEALDAAAAEGLFSADDWEMVWIGRDAPEAVLSRGIVPRVMSPLAWGEYQDFIMSVDAGLVLMDTPHPSYPPLDLAAAGAAVLTNTHPGKQSLSHYSDNILVAEPTVEALVEGLSRLQALAEDEAERARRREADRIGRDWTEALEPVVSRLAARLGARA